MKRSILIQTLCAGTGFALLTGSADAGTLTLDAVETILVSTTAENTSDINLSLYAGSAGYSSPLASGVFGDGTALDYRLVTGGTINGAGYADGGGGRVGEMFVPDANLSGGSKKKLNVWTATDPAGFTSTPDFANVGMAKAALVTGDIDISGLAAGIIYFIHGSFADAGTVQVTMTGAGQADVNALHSHDPVGGTRQFWVSSFDFTNPSDDYDTISFTYTNNDTDGSRARFGGVILDEVATTIIPEPTSLVAGLAMGGMFVMRRRRRID